jgi:tetratricopeptide (TPR) repeat protein
MLRTLLLLSLLALPAAHASADQDDERLDALFLQLKEAASASAALAVEAQIWSIWLEHDDAQARSLMQRGIAQMNTGDLRGALATFDQLVQQAPEFAEAWNKRATVQYLLGNHKASEADIDATLKLEPFHFGALSGLGLVCLAQSDLLRARSAFLSALEVYPELDGARATLEALERQLRATSI